MGSAVGGKEMAGVQDRKLALEGQIGVEPWDLVGRVQDAGAAEVFVLQVERVAYGTLFHLAQELDAGQA